MYTPNISCWPSAASQVHKVNTLIIYSAIFGSTSQLTCDAFRGIPCPLIFVNLKHFLHSDAFWRHTIFSMSIMSLNALPMRPVFSLRLEHYINHSLTSLLTYLTNGYLSISSTFKPHKLQTSTQSPRGAHIYWRRIPNIRDHWVRLSLWR